MPTPFTHRLRVRYAECDAQSIVFNANWLTYFDVVNTELWRELAGGYEAVRREHGVETVVAETGLRFRGAARFDDVLDFTAVVARIGKSSMRMEIAATRESDLLVEGFLEYVFVDRKRFRPAPIPDAIREALEAVSPPD
ncbi:MAG: thioesterase family protein [Solirubrobacterales bacterium]